MRRSGAGLILGLHRSAHHRLILEYALSRGVLALDTAYNYRGFSSHRVLAAAAADLLCEFAISTKVGFFPGPNGAPVHSLDPVRLRDTVDESVTTLGSVPEVVFLYNPERALPGADPAAEFDRLATAGQVLDDAAAAGSCRSWGWSAWDTRPLAAALPDTAAVAAIPAPQVLMVRAGLLATADVLDTGEHLADVFGLDAGARWGMSPFGGNAAHPVWDMVDPCGFLAPHHNAAVAQALLAVAFALPTVGRIAVGADNPTHLDALITATGLDVDEARVTRYRGLLRGKMVRTAAR